MSKRKKLGTQTKTMLGQSESITSKRKGIARGAKCLETHQGTGGQTKEKWGGRCFKKGQTVQSAARAGRTGGKDQKEELKKN